MIYLSLSLYVFGSLAPHGLTGFTRVEPFVFYCCGRSFAAAP